ncbi:MAG: HPr(Ser) kinase/phosphatase [Christensenellales bacterium]|jgi:HPr kinase/phosphorylase
MALKTAVNIKKFAKDLDLRIVSPVDKEEFYIETADLNRPGLQFAGFFTYFAQTRVQVMGMAEMSYIKEKPPEYRREVLERYFSYKVPCVIIARGLRAPKEMLEEAKKAGVPIFSSRQTTTRFTLRVIHYLTLALAPTITRHGVLLDVFGVGVMFLGDSGIGKSETALELIKRGHRLVADDVVEITRVADNRLIGKAPEFVRHLMEIRGIGIIDIRNMYGAGAVAYSKSIELVIELEMWEQGKAYDRLGTEEQYAEILDVNVPKYVTPVKPGRNIAIIVEVAARNFNLKRLGYDAAKEFEKRMRKNIESFKEKS